MKLGNLEKARELSGIHERLSRDLTSLAFDGRTLKKVTFDFGGPNVNLDFSNTKLLELLVRETSAFIVAQREALEKQIEDL